MSNNIHDKVFADLLNERVFFEALLKNYLPKEVADRIDWKIASFSKMDTRHLNQKTKQAFIADVIYLAKINAQNDLMYFHFEHQSEPDKSMPLRVTNYASAALLNYIKASHGKQKVPPIISFVYYQGIKPYPYEISLKNVFRDSELWVKYFGQPILIDLDQMSDDQLRTHQDIGVIELILKHIRRKDFSKNYRELIAKLSISSDNLRRIVLRYILERADVPTESLAEAMLESLPQDKGVIMTSGDQLRQQGRQQALRDTAQKMLARGIDLDAVHDCTELSFEVLEKLREEVVVN